MQQSREIEHLVRDGRIALVGAMYDVVTGQIDFFPDACPSIFIPIPMPPSTP